MKNVSLYIPVYNAAGCLARVLEAALGQTRSFAQIIVVDDGSDDDSAKIASRYGVGVFSHKGNQGIAAARNTGISCCGTDFIASIDADCVIDPGWLEACLSSFDDPAVGGVGGRLEESSKTLTGRWRARHLVQHFGDSRKDVSFLSGSNTVFRRKVLYDAGLYNTVFMRNHEDTDLSERVVAQGWTLRYVPEARARHCKRDTVYSVMRSCWGFRHRSYPRSFGVLLFDCGREGLRSVVMMLRTVFSGALSLLLIDSLYFCMQSYFSIKAFCLKSANFK